MCGIAGFMLADPEAPPSEALLRTMASTLAHRGPDGDGFFVKPGIALAHRRLAIIDIATGDQPMLNEDKSVAVVFNGEIENYRVLTRELADQGHRFATHSDTETIIHLYEEEGENLCPRLRGFFAFAIWDASRRRLLLARDRLGEKPLYYLKRPEGIYFASEAKALLHVPGFERCLDPTALDSYLTFLHVPYNTTFFKGISKLMPGERLVVEEGRVRDCRSWWTVPECDPPADPISRLREIFAETVSLKLQSDVPVGVFLSGGIDSGLVAAQTQREVGEVLTFTMGVENDRMLDERADARRTAEFIGAENHHFVQQPEGFERTLSRSLWHNDEPTAGASALALGALARQARQHVTVVLGGDGGDEAFVGYPRHLIGLLRRTPAWPLAVSLWRRHGPASFYPIMSRLFTGSFSAFYYDLLTFFNDRARVALRTPELSRSLSTATHVELIDRLLSSRKDVLSAIQMVDWAIYLPSTLHQTDRMTMSAGIECRAPFLDHELISFAANLPATMKLNGQGMKPLLHAAFKEYLPSQTWHAPKRGFPIPFGRWFRRDILPFVQKVLLGRRAAARGLFRPEAIQRLLDRHRRLGDRSVQVYQLLSVESWCRLFLDAPPAISADSAESIYADEMSDDV